MIIKVPGIVLKQNDYKENDALVLVFTKEYGLITFYARGVRKVASKNVSALFPYSESEFIFDDKSENKFVVLHSATTINSHRKVQEDLMKSSVAMVMAELLEKIGKEIVDDPYLQEELYTLYSDCLNYLNQKEDIWLASGLFFANILNLMGISPEVDECAICGNTHVSSVSIDFGGFVCLKCVPNYSEDILFLKQFRLLNKGKSEHLSIMEQYGPYQKKHVEYLKEFLIQYLSIPIKSWDFLEEVLKLHK